MHLQSTVKAIYCVSVITAIHILPGKAEVSCDRSFHIAESRGDTYNQQTISYRLIIIAKALKQIGPLMQEIDIMRLQLNSLGQV